MIDSLLKRQLLFNMLRIRMVEETIAKRYPDQEIRCPVHLSIGQEAIAVGVCLALDKTDYVMSTHRAHAHYLAKGGSLKALLAELYGKATGCTSGKGGSMHLVDLDANMLGSTPIVGSSLPVAVGTAFGSWMDENKRVTTIFFGEGATEEGVFLESLNFAALKKLPIIFICENNFYSVYSPLSVRQPPQRDRMAIAKAHGIYARSGDGNDVESIYHLAKEALTRAKEGLGPTYLEFETYRWLEHCGPNYDNNIGYRSEEEFLSWQKRCPIKKYQKILSDQKIISNEEMNQMSKSIRQEIDEAFSYAKESPLPNAEELLTNIYAPTKI